jgi:transcription elongation factor Elf1
MVAKSWDEHWKKKREELARLKKLRETRNPGVKFPYKCSKCGNLTKKVSSGKWKGTYHCKECGSYQEFLNVPAFTMTVKKRK